MNTFVIAFAAAVAVLSQNTSAQCIPTCGNIVASPLLLPAPVLSQFITSPIVSTPIVSTPIVPTTTIVQTSNSVTDSLVDTLQLLTVTSLLADQLPYGPNLCLPVASPVLSAPIVSPCGCGGPIISNPIVSTCGCGPIITNPIVSTCGCGPIINSCGCGPVIF